jgi:hypothetical protein
MTVVLIIGAVASAAVYVAGPQARLAPAYTRSLLAALQETRHAALTSGQPARLRLQPDGASVLALPELRQPGAPSSWTPLGGALQAPASVYLCEVEARTRLTPGVPVCPLRAPISVCFSPAGWVTVSAAATCPGTGSGATLYLGTEDGRRRYRIALFGLTGLGRMADGW